MSSIAVGTRLDIEITVMAVLIVPRGETDEFYEYLSIIARVNGDELIIDRRRHQRRQVKNQAIGKRQAQEDRRGPIPERWQRDNLIVVD
jgi:hypothetical protein